MKVLIIGCGLVGKELAKQLKADGHTVVGTTTTPGKVAALNEVCSEVRVLRGSDTELVHEAAKGCDAIAVCAGPAAQQAMTPEQMHFVQNRTIMREIRRKEVLYLPGEPGDRIYLLKRGVVKISALPEDGREVILALLRKGEVFGEEAVLDDAPRDHMAEAYPVATAA